MSGGLTSEELARVFPFHIASDKKLRIVSVGPSLARLSPNLPGALLGEVARVLRPAGGLDLEVEEVATSVPVLLELGEPVVVLRGEALFREDELLLLVSPWVSDAGQLERLGLCLHDFADHDPIVDYLALLEARSAALAQANALSVRLKEASHDIARALEQREIMSARLEALIRRLPFGLLVEDEAGKVVLTNERYLELFGIGGEPADLVGTSRIAAAAGASVCFPDPELFVRGVEARLGAREPVIAEELELSDGRTFERDFLPIFDAHTYRGNMWQYRDVTAQRRAALRLSVARERAEVASAAKTRFLAMMSHEIRTPLGAIVGLSELLRGAPAPEEQRALVERLGRNAQHLIELLEDILDFAKIEAGEVRVFNTAFDPRALVREALDTLFARASEKGLELHAEVHERVPRHVVGDATRVRQVLVNLVSNAVKFTPHGRVTVRLGVREQQAERVVLVYEVVDTGRGIAREAQDRIFGRFVRITQVDGEHVPGTGLGLSIVQGLVELMGGKVEIQSELGLGSTFRAFVPHEVASNEEARRTDPAPRRALPQTRARLLLLEDDVDNRTVIRAILEQAGHHVEAVGDGAAGLSLATRAPFDLVLSDLQMPGMDGITFTRRLREHERREGVPRSPVVAVTAHAVASFRERALEAGMDDFAAKPVSARQLQRLVERWADTRPLALAVDDHADHRLVLQRTLGQTEAVRLKTVPSAEAMFDVLEARPVDLILLDMSMPGMSGYEAAQRVRARAALRRLPIIALTGHAGEDQAQRCREAGCDVHLVKPVRPRVLERIVEKLLARGEPNHAAGARPERVTATPAPLTDLVPQYLLRRRHDLSAIVGHIRDGSAAALREAARMAHNAKGTGGAYGLPWLSEEAGALELALLRGELRESARRAEEMLRRLAQIDDEAEQALGASSTVDEDLAP